VEVECLLPREAFCCHLMTKKQTGGILKAQCTCDSNYILTHYVNTTCKVLYNGILYKNYSRRAVCFYMYMWKQTMFTMFNLQPISFKWKGSNAWQCEMSSTHTHINLPPLHT
jgi:hypothetical protein